MRSQIAHLRQTLASADFTRILDDPAQITGVNVITAKLTDADADTLRQMADQGGRDTEQDIFGCPGGYKTLLCKNTLNTPCTVCGTIIMKKAYMGGSIYYCENCQQL